MSIRFEYVPASCGIYICNEHDLAVEDPHEREVLVLSYDEAIVIDGTRDELREFADRLHAVVYADPPTSQ